MPEARCAKSRVRSDPPGHPGRQAKTTPRCDATCRNKGTARTSPVLEERHVPFRSAARPFSPAHRFLCGDAVIVPGVVGGAAVRSFRSTSSSTSAAVCRGTGTRVHPRASGVVRIGRHVHGRSPSKRGGNSRPRWHRMGLSTSSRATRMVSSSRSDQGGHMKPGWPIDEEPGADFGSPAVGQDGSVHVEECAGAKVGCRLRGFDESGRERSGWPVAIPTTSPAQAKAAASRRPGHRTRWNRIRIPLAGWRRLAIPRHRPFGQDQARMAGRTTAGAGCIGRARRSPPMERCSCSASPTAARPRPGSRHSAPTEAHEPAGPCRCPTRMTTCWARRGRWSHGPWSTTPANSVSSRVEPSSRLLAPMDGRCPAGHAGQRDSHRLRSWTRKAPSTTSRPRARCTRTTVPARSRPVGRWRHMEPPTDVAVGRRPHLAPDGTIVVVGDEVTALSPDGRSPLGWPYRPSGDLVEPCLDSDCYARHGSPAFGLDGTVYVVEYQTDGAAIRAEIVALDRHGQPKPGWPYRLPFDANTIQIAPPIVSPDGRLIVHGMSSPFELLALDADGTLAR